MFRAVLVTEASLRRERPMLLRVVSGLPALLKKPSARALFNCSGRRRNFLRWSLLASSLLAVGDRFVPPREVAGLVALLLNGPSRREFLAAPAALRAEVALVGLARDLAQRLLIVLAPFLGLVWNDGAAGPRCVEAELILCGVAEALRLKGRAAIEANDGFG